MKKHFWVYFITAAIAATAIFIACEKKDDGSNNGGNKTVAVTGVSLDKPTATLTLGTSTSVTTLTPTVSPASATNKAVSWESSNPTVATVISTGLVTAIAPGNATIAVTTADGNKTATCVVTVNAGTTTPTVVPVTGVSLNSTTATLTVGGTYTLTATVSPTTATNKAVSWNSSSTVITVSGGTSSVATITAAATGTAVITVTTVDGSKTATCAVTVSATTLTMVPVTDVTLDQTAVTLTRGNPGSVTTLTATVLPDNAYNKTVTWKSNNTSVATVTTSGVVTARSNGQATITAASNDGTNKTAICVVMVQTVPVTSITLSQTAATLTRGNSGSVTILSATVLPDNAYNKTVTWRTSNSGVAAVNNGTVTAIAPGNATITVTTQNGNKTATCVVTVTEPITGVSLSQTTATMGIGRTLILTPTVNPYDATNKAVTWNSNNTAVATVDIYGMVTAVSLGEATITVTTQDGGKTASCVVTVIPVPVTGVSLNRTTVLLSIGGTAGTLSLMPNVSPYDATNKAVTWMSTNPAVATVNNGTVTAVGYGTATITVTTQDGGKTASCVVTVPNLAETVSFATNQTWTVGNQIWSDAVQMSYCSNKTTYEGVGVDCRSNPGYKGDFFSWYAVDAYKDQLCPYPWRVPTRQDFIDLDIALGGEGKVSYSEVHVQRYLNSWGAMYGGFAFPDLGPNIGLANRGYAGYYMGIERDFETGCNCEPAVGLMVHWPLFVSYPAVLPGAPLWYTHPGDAYTLRCVKDK